MSHNIHDQAADTAHRAEFQAECREVGELAVTQATAAGAYWMTLSQTDMPLEVKRVLVVNFAAFLASGTLTFGCDGHGQEGE